MCSVNLLLPWKVTPSSILLSYGWSVVHTVSQRAKIPEKSGSFRKLTQNSFYSSHVFRNWDFLQDSDGLMKLPL